MTRIHIILALFVATASICPGMTDAEFDPWSVANDAPVPLIGSPSSIPPPSPPALREASTLPIFYCNMLLTFYQKGLSRVKRSSCSLEPSCSRYSAQAVHRHGALLGIAMTADRLIHEMDLIRKADPFANRPDGRIPDGLDRNDFWWYPEKRFP